MEPVVWILLGDFLRGLITLGVVFAAVALAIVGAMAVVKSVERKVTAFGRSISEQISSVSVKSKNEMLEAARAQQQQMAEALRAEVENLKRQAAEETARIQAQIEKCQESVTNTASSVQTQIEKCQESVTNTAATVQVQIEKCQESVTNTAATVQVQIEKCQESVTTTASTVQAQIEKCQISVSGAANSISNAAEKVGGAADAATGIAGTASHASRIIGLASVALSIYSLARNVYGRIRARKESWGQVRDAQLLRAFDSIALVVMIPMLYMGGPSAALAVWRDIKLVITQVKDALSFYSFYRTIFGGSEVGGDYAEDIAKSVDELGVRVSVLARDRPEVKQADITPPSPSSSPSIPFASLDEFGGVEEIGIVPPLAGFVPASPEVPLEEAEEDAVARKFGIYYPGIDIAHLTRKEVVALVRQYEATQQHAELRKVWDKQESSSSSSTSHSASSEERAASHFAKMFPHSADREHVKKLCEYIANNRYYAAAVIVLVFAIILVICRKTLRKPTPTIRVQIKEKVLENARLNVELERSSRNVRKQKAAAARGSKKKVGPSGGYEEDDQGLADQTDGLKDDFFNLRRRLYDAGGAKALDDYLQNEENPNATDADIAYARGGKQALGELYDEDFIMGSKLSAATDIDKVGPSYARRREADLKNTKDKAHASEEEFAAHTDEVKKAVHDILSARKPTDKEATVLGNTVQFLATNLSRSALSAMQRAMHGELGFNEQATMALSTQALGNYVQGKLDENLDNLANNLVDLEIALKKAELAKAMATKENGTSAVLVKTVVRKEGNISALFRTVATFAIESMIACSIFEARSWEEVLKYFFAMNVGSVLGAINQAIDTQERYLAAKAQADQKVTDVKATKESDKPACTKSGCDTSCGNYHNVVKKNQKAVKSAFKSLVCHRCRKPGHVATVCKTKMPDDCWCLPKDDKHPAVYCDKHKRAKADVKTIHPAVQQEKASQPPVQKETYASKAAGSSSSKKDPVVAAPAVPHDGTALEMFERAIKRLESALKAKPPTPPKPVPTVTAGKKEALVNGAQYRMVNATKHIAVATVVLPDGLSRTNATLIANGIEVSRHVFGMSPHSKIDPDLTIEFRMHGVEEPLVRKYSEGKLISNDTLYFLRGSWAQGVGASMQMSVPRPEDKVILYAYKSLDDCEKGELVMDASTIVHIDLTDKEEMAWYASSSEAGNCGAPVVNVHGKVVGFHNCTTNVATGFIPVTPLMLARISDPRLF